MTMLEISTLGLLVKQTAGLLVIFIEAQERLNPKVALWARELILSGGSRHLQQMPSVVQLPIMVTTQLDTMKLNIVLCITDIGMRLIMD
jgi:hypothetical protein